MYSRMFVSKNALATLMYFFPADRARIALEIGPAFGDRQQPIGRGPRPIGCWRSPNAGPISSAIRARSAGKKYMSVAKAFFDTNILLYMYGGSDPAKQAKAAELFNAQTRTARAVVSTQVVQEFYAVATRKLGMASEVAGRIVRSLLSLPLVIIDADSILTALAMEERYQISFWDALIVAATEAAGAQVLYTEDLNDGQQYGQVVVRNPFRE